MIRTLVIVIACFAGVVVAWLFVPTDKLALPMLNGPAASESNGAQSAAGKQARRKYDLMSEDERRAHAERLIGTNLSYARNDAVYQVEWFADQGDEILEAAMDECYLILDGELYRRHLAARGEIDDNETGSGQLTQPVKIEPTTGETRNCLTVYRAYGRLHHTDFNF